jgi:hypothetical protein
MGLSDAYFGQLGEVPTLQRLPSPPRPWPPITGWRARAAALPAVDGIMVSGSMMEEVDGVYNFDTKRPDTPTWSNGQFEVGESLWTDHAHARYQYAKH